MPELIYIKNKAIPLGANVAINFDIARLPTNTVINLPVHVFRGKDDGPVLLLMAGLHGDEINGIETIRRMIFDQTVHIERGTVMAIPIVNVYGFLHSSRDLPDGKDLNRCFPGSKNGSLANRVAYFLIHDILPQIDVGIDFHTGAVHRTNFPQTRCKVDLPINVELARAFGAPFILNAEFRDKSIRKEAAKRGKPIIVFEAGEALRLDEKGINDGVLGTYRVMRHLGMISQEIPAAPSQILSGSTWLRARVSGLYRNYVEPGAFVKKNQVLASITDPYGSKDFKVKTHVEGYVIGLNYLPVVNAGDALIHIGLL